MSDFQKQTVQWFPGHMAKTRRLIKENLKLVDAVTEIADSRIPESSRNPEVAEIISAKPRLIILNKFDLADDKSTKEWISFYRLQGISAIAADCRTGKGLNAWLPELRRLLKAKIEANKAKGMAGKPLRVMVVGIPNTGKSSFINRMSKRSRAAVADRPGVTRQNQWFPVDNGIELLDTPGVLWPKFEDPKVGDMLAFIGSIKDEISDPEILVLRFLKLMMNEYPERLSQRYKIGDSIPETPDGLLELIAKKRGMLISGGEADLERASIMLLDEYRAGKLGRITLELPPGL